MPRLLLAAAFALASMVSSIVLTPSPSLAQSNDDFAYGVIVDSTDPRSMARAREPVHARENDDVLGSSGAVRATTSGTRPTRTIWTISSGPPGTRR